MVTILIYNRDNAIKGCLWPFQKLKSHKVYGGSGGQLKYILLLKEKQNGKN